MTMQEMKFSVIMSIYQNDVPEHLHIALESLLNQTRRPDEIVIVGDGPVPAELEQVIESLPTEGSGAAGSKFKVQGSNALKRVQDSKLHTDLTELTDSITQTSRFNSQSSIAFGDDCHDSVNQASLLTLAAPIILDIAVPDRFEKQLRFLEQHPDVAAVGGMIEDFSSDPNHVTGRRVVPLESDDIHRYMRSRNGMNHVTVMFKKEELLRVGNYQPFHLNEDYYLWVRMIQQGCQLMNIPDVLVRVRAEKEQVDRRGGFPYFRDQYRVFKYMLNTGFISWPRFLLNICERGTVQLLMPLSVRCWFYQRFLRK